MFRKFYASHRRQRRAGAAALGTSPTWPRGGWTDSGKWVFRLGHGGGCSARAGSRGLVGIFAATRLTSTRAASSAATRKSRSNASRHRAARSEVKRASQCAACSASSSRARFRGFCRPTRGAAHRPRRGCDLDGPALPRHRANINIGWHCFDALTHGTRTRALSGLGGFHARGRRTTWEFRLRPACASRRAELTAE